jgi:hypothetical protein
MIHDLLHDLNAMKFFNSEAVQTVVEKYGYEVVDFHHIYNAFVLVIAPPNEERIYHLVFVKPTRRWYISEKEEVA